MAIQFEKPPLGVRPAFVAAWERIGELNDGIRRQYEAINGDAKLVMRWAGEIKLQCQIIEAFGKDEKE